MLFQMWGNWENEKEKIEKKIDAGSAKFLFFSNVISHFYIQLNKGK